MSLKTTREGAILIVEIDRQDRANAYDRSLLEALDRALTGPWDATLGSPRVLIVQSAGDRAFCAGADLDGLSKADPLDALDLFSQAVFTRLARQPAVSIAAVHGPAVAGGCELALACDLRIVGPRAAFWLPETSLGILPSAGGCTRLTRLVGPSVAKQVILGGRRLDAEASVRLGLAWEQCDDPRGRALELAKELARRDPVAQRLARQIIDQGEREESLVAERVAEAFLYGRKQRTS